MHVLLSPLSLSLLRSKIITVKSKIIMGDFATQRKRERKKRRGRKGKGGEITRKKKQQRRRAEKSALMSLMAVACSEREDDWHCFGLRQTARSRPRRIVEANCYVHASSVKEFRLI